MFANIVALLVVAFVLAKLVKGGYFVKVFEFLGLVKESAQKNGARGTAHSIIDGLFNNADTIKGAVKNGAKKVTGTAKAKAAGLKPQDYEFNPDTRELTLFLSKTQDLVLGRRADGRIYSILVDVNGTEMELTKKAFERQVNMLLRKNKLSESQARAMKDFMAMSRGAAKTAAAPADNTQRKTPFPRNLKDFQAALKDEDFKLDL